MTKIEEFIEVMKLGMISNFETDGYLSPMFFYLQNKQPFLEAIPPELFTPKGKLELINYIKGVCMKPGVIMAGLVTEADIKRIPESDKDKYLSGELKISNQIDKDEIIAIIISTPEKTYSITYHFDRKNKKVFGGNTNKDEMVGLFSDFFTWTKN